MTEDMPSTIDIEKLRKVAEISLQCLHEQDDPSDSITDEPGHDGPEDIGSVAWIRDQLARGNEWAWFCAKITASYAGVTSDANYLGACSYESKAAFTDPADGYYADMVKECVQDLADKLDEIDAALVEVR